MDSYEDGEAFSAAAIAAGILAGDKQAERELCVRFRGGIVLMLRRRLTDRWLAEDVANDALSCALDLLRNEPLDEPDKLAAFVHGIALNCARNANRKEARQKTQADTETVETTLDVTRDPALINMRASLARLVRSILSSLPVARDREILARYYLHEDEKHDICRDLSLTDEHFDRVVHRARRRMLAHIEEVDPQFARLKDFLALI